MLIYRLIYARMLMLRNIKSCQLKVSGYTSCAVRWTVLPSTAYTYTFVNRDRNALIMMIDSRSFEPTRNLPFATTYPEQ